MWHAAAEDRVAPAAGPCETARSMAVPISRILEARGAARLAFSPDGRTLYYVTDLTGTTQLWSIPVGGGHPIRLTYDCDRVGAYRVSPDGRAVAYGTDVGGNERWAIHVMGADGTRERTLTSRPERIHHVAGWTPDSSGILAATNERDERYFDLRLIDAEGGTARTLFEHDGTAASAGVLRDGRVVLATHLDRLDLHRLTLIESDGTARRITPDDPPAMHADPQAFDGGVLVRTDRGRDVPGLAAVGLDGSYRSVRELEREIDEHAVRGATFAYAVNVDGRSEVRIGIGTADRVLDLPQGALPQDLVGDGLALAADGTVAVAWARYDTPASIFVVAPGGALRELVPAQRAGMSPDDLPADELVSWTSFDGLRIPGFLLRPRGAPAGPRPTVIQVHGGPEGQATPRWDPLTVALVAAGMNVLQPNVRGSRGYGRAYMSLDDGRRRMDAVRDLDAAAAWLAATGIAPADRIGVMGSSYGGFMTLAALTHCAERRWAAGVDIVGIASFRSFFERTAPWRRPLRAIEYGSPDRDADLFDEISPLGHVDRITAPLMVIHGANDPRVPVEEAEQIVAALKARGVPVEYLRYEDEGHGLAKAKNRADAWPKVVAFLSRYLLG